MADCQRTAVAPTLAAAAERAGWAFELYYDARRKGRHFGGGDPNAVAPGKAAGSLVVGGRHADQLLWLGSAYELVALGDPESLLWTVVEAMDAEILMRSVDPAALYGAAFERLRQTLPSRALVVDAAPQGANGLTVSPYLYPAFLSGDPVLGVEVTGSEGDRRGLEELGVREFSGSYVDRERALAFPGGIDELEGDAAAETYASLTAALAKRHATWGRGVLIGDPDLVAAQLPKARRLRLVPLYGQPQTSAIERASELIGRSTEPVYGRQYDDRDFFELGKLGHGLQIVDPAPPFDAAHLVEMRIPQPPKPLWDAEPEDSQLEEWAAEGRVLVTLLFWSGMIRELDCLPRVLDLVADTELRAGLVVTRQTLEYAAGSSLELLAVPPERGGVFGLLEPLLGCTGEGVAAETLMPPGTLDRPLADARAFCAERLSPGLAPRGWWPLLDAPLVPHRTRALEWHHGRPLIRFPPRGVDGAVGEAGRSRRDLRSLVGRAVRGSNLEALFEARRPFDDQRPGALDESVADAVRAAGFSYMWSKAAFGRPTVLLRRGDFVALPLTAGNWDGWSPFYTAGDAKDVARAERRLVRGGRPGWLATTIDSPLWMLPGEVLEHGARLHRIASLVAAGGRSGRLVNVTPHVIARYARLLDEHVSASDRS